jgi:GAF domain-containing protein
VTVSEASTPPRGCPGAPSASSDLPHLEGQDAPVLVAVPTSTDGDTPTVESIVQLLTLVRADLAAELDQDASPEQLLDRIIRIAISLVPGAEAGSISLLSDGALQTVAADGDAAFAIDDLQAGWGQGPSWQAVLEGRALRVDDLVTDPRWLEMSALAGEIGVRAVLACSLPMPRKQQGVLSLYSSRPAAFDAAAELVVPVFAARAAIATAYADKVSQLKRAMESRQLIGQAVGILMERHRLSSRQGFDTLVKASQEAHLKLREVAQRVIETGEEPAVAAEGRD